MVDHEYIAKPDKRRMSEEGDREKLAGGLIFSTWAYIHGLFAAYKFKSYFFISY